ncbi:UDP-N-acetylmuramoyl-L-alanine--D-glutamate ligase [candidate division WOR-3 bacterium JGI_Cruoil_03_51_56]|uniref:UDP-N-acetylmuramoylalanine--D-glutamate ligase n=1 Tax=candidate division WOR-3 bacterium JGI_Cruoil_03_51_56 TaxID=1973747 RepID=A0A235BW05_UNCW3|nr:MAG: UDP-N-acetylmuramoyl-L-alanine--D-glutamate ligase [candidate division WOR-3 bacterium JGI_Cruoil_03_51_56]
MEKPLTVEELKNCKVFIFGLGRAGIAVGRFLLRLGTRVSGYDDNPAIFSRPMVKRLAKTGMKVVQRPGSAKIDLAIVSPGISEENEVVRGLRVRGIPIVDELDLASQFVRGPLIAITGTNGKSTTTALIADILKRAGKRVFIGGNITPGKPLSAALNIPKQDFYVVEVSSFQLERAQWFKPKVAVILNIVPDHLNRHQTMKEYAECKFRILDRQGPEDYAVLNYDDKVVMPARNRGKAKKQFFSLRYKVDGAYQRQGWLFSQGTRVARIKGIRLRGKHNLQNALGAVCVVKLLAIPLQPVRQALAGFNGLAHRLELVAKLNRVEYFNNSMCTNPTAGVKSLQAFHRKVVLITGGREKDLPVNDYVHAIARKAKWVVLLGENSEKMARLLSGAGFYRFQICEDMRQAVAVAKKMAKPGDVVLFSPGFASFDLFANFQERGRAFRKEVGRLG